jgi:hypothetical protein
MRRWRRTWTRSRGAEAGGFSASLQWVQCFAPVGPVGPVGPVAGCGGLVTARVRPDLMLVDLQGQLIRQSRRHELPARAAQPCEPGEAHLLAERPPDSGAPAIWAGQLLVPFPMLACRVWCGGIGRGGWGNVRGFHSKARRREGAKDGRRGGGRGRLGWAQGDSSCPGRELRPCVLAFDAEGFGDH